jgi:hypothetical protein
MDKIKAFFSSLISNIGYVMGAVLAILLYIIGIKNKKIDALQAQIAMVKTVEQADAIEANITDQMNNVNIDTKTLEKLQQAVVQLRQKRADLSNGVKTPQEIEDYWKNN